MDCVFRTISKAVLFVKAKKRAIGNRTQSKKNIDTCVDVGVYLISEQRESSCGGSWTVTLKPIRTDTREKAY
jgi:hypothetical protein